MKLSKKTSALILAASALLAAAVPAKAQTTINFGGFSENEAIPFATYLSQGVVFSSLDVNNNIGGGAGAVYEPSTEDGATNSTHGSNYPTSKLLKVNFLQPATLNMFFFDSEDYSSSGLGHVTYSAFNSSGALIASGTANSDGTTPFVLNLKGVSLLEFDNGSTSSSGNWWFNLQSITFMGSAFSFNSFALTPNQHAVASALDHSLATNDPGIQPLFNGLLKQYLMDNVYGQNSNFFPQSFDMISGAELTSVFNTAYDVAHVQNSAITNHLAEYQAGDESGVGTGLISLDMAAGGKSGDGKETKGGGLQPLPEDRWGFFATANGNFTDIQGDSNSNGFQYATEGVTIGADYHLTPNLVLGGYLAYEHSFTNYVNNGAIDANGITGGLYGTWFSHGFYVNGIVGGGYSGFTDRRLSIGGNTRGDGDDTLLNAALNGGYDMHSGPWTFGPQLGVEYDDVFLDSFTEQGSLAPLSVADQSENSLRSTAGAHISYATHWGSVTVRPDIHAAWQHEYDSTTSSLGAGIAGTNAAFVVQGPYLGRDSALAGAGVTFDLSDKTSVYVDYEGQFGRQHTTQSDISAGFSTKF